MSFRVVSISVAVGLLQFEYMFVASCMEYNENKISLALYIIIYPFGV